MFIDADELVEPEIKDGLTHSLLKKKLNMPEILLKVYNKTVFKTFVNIDLKALELSKTAVPQKLTNLWERYKLEQERTGKSVYRNSGFAGTGFKFDEAEKQMDKDRKNMQKAALGLNVSFNY